VIDEIRSFLPLSIAAIERDADGIGLAGNSWRLRINTNWRILSGGQIVNSSSILESESPSSLRLEDLIGEDVNDVCSQSSRAGLDLSVVTSGGHIIEIFSDFSYGEWSFSMWNSEDPRRIPTFDLEGPIPG
jgi:hypothetical protein